MLSVRLEFGYWVFEGDGLASQRPSWNYRTEQGGGIVLDMFSHRRYLLERRELVELQVDGTSGSAVAGLRNCAVQHRATTPMPVWNPDLPDPIDYLAQWTDVPDNGSFDNGFKVQWETFLRHAATGEPFP